MAKKIPADVAKVRERANGVAGRGKAPRAKKRADRLGMKVLRANWQAAECKAADLRLALAKLEQEKAVLVTNGEAFLKELSRLTSWTEVERQRLKAANSVVEAQAKRIEELKAASAPVLYVRELEAERDGLLAAAKQRSADYVAACRRLEASEKAALARVEELTAQNLRLVDEMVEAKKAAGGSPELIREAVREVLASLRAALADRDAAFIELRAACEKAKKAEVGDDVGHAACSRTIADLRLELQDVESSRAMLQEAYDRLRKEREADLGAFSEALSRQTSMVWSWPGLSEIHWIESTRENVDKTVAAFGECYSVRFPDGVTRVVPNERVDVVRRHVGGGVALQVGQRQGDVPA